MKFTNFNRKDYIGKLTEEEFDVLIIGGGITGAGIALDAVTRGMKVALVDMQDFSAGTSSRSTKLVHGGLRYLKQLEFKVVAEVGKERAVVYENGPHVTTPEWMLLPIHKGGTFGKFSTSIGLRVYDFLAGVKKSERRKMISGKDTLNKEPLLKREGLQGGGYYVEYRTDDARLTVEVLKEAVASGAIALNYAKVNQLEYQDGSVCGAVVHDLLNDSIFKVKAKKVVNATGPWVDTIREKDHSKKGKKLRLSKGVHLVIDQTKFPLKQAIYFDTPDGRMVFAIPRAGKAYVGTTDTFYDQDPINPTMTESDRNYIIDAIHYMFPKVKIGIGDIESSWAGVRPLIYEEGKDPSEISRKDEIWTSQSGLITIAGGKLTGYRKMAETVVDLLAVELGNGNGRYSTCHTKNMPISGGKVGGSENFTTFIQSQVAEGIKAGLTKKDAENIAAMYGSNANILFEIAALEQKKAEKSNLPLLLLTQLVYALEYEMIANPVDFFFRRTGYLLFDIELVKKYEQEVLLIMADRLNWSEKQTENFKKELSLQIIDSTIPLDDSNRNDVIKKLS